MKCKYCNSEKVELEIRQIGTQGMTVYQNQCKKCFRWQPIKMDAVDRAMLH
jgi:hypothetical protein